MKRGWEVIEKTKPPSSRGKIPSHGFGGGNSREGTSFSPRQKLSDDRNKNQILRAGSGEQGDSVYRNLPTASCETLIKASEKVK